MHHFRRHNQFTLGGLAFIALTAVVFTAAYNSASNNLYIILGMMVGLLVAAAVLATRRAFRRLHISRVLPENAVAGEPAEILYRLENRRRFWPVFALRLDEDRLPFTPGEAFFPHIPAKGHASAVARLVPPRRGRLLLDGVRLRSSFPLGLLTRISYHPLPGSLIVYPRVGVLHRKIALAYREAVDSGALTSSRRGGNDEFYGLREYRPGDNVRAIHWRSTARTNELMVRELTANAPPQLILLLYLGPDAPAPVVESAIELAATLAGDAFLENYAISLVVPGLHTEIPAPAAGRAARADLLRQLALLDHAALNSALPIAAPTRAASRAHHVVVATRAADPWRNFLPPAAAHHATVLPLDHPDAATWIHHLAPTHSPNYLRPQKKSR